MSFRGHKGTFRVLFGIVCLCTAAVTLPTPASAGFFERLFGAVRHSFQAPRPPTVVQPFADPFGDERGVNLPRDPGGPSVAYCVRSCDGQFFPVRAQPGLSAAEACRSFCPAAKTQLYSGSSIDTAIATNGSRYADLPNAYAYRKELVAGCTCNGREPFGLARIDATSDPTLRPGDIVATENGLVAFTGSRSGAATFTPVRAYSGYRRSERGRLSELKVSRSTPIARATNLSTGPRESDSRSAQLEK
jgi:hypothetical protein